MPSKYLFLNSQVATISEGKIVWNNLPTLSESTREAYVSIYDMSVLVINTVNYDSPIFVKINLPSINYFSSDNRSPTMLSLPLTSVTDVFASNSGSPSIELLTNDNLKSIEVELVDLDNDPIVLAVLSVNLTLKIDYVDQKAIAQDYLSQIPMRL